MSMRMMQFLKQRMIRFAGEAILLMGAGPALHAQQAVTVRGYVSSRGAPLPGAHVIIDELKIDRVTDAQGYYSFIVPARSVRGQTVTVYATMSDKRVRYTRPTARLILNGASLAQNFELSPLATRLPDQVVSELSDVGSLEANSIAPRDVIQLDSAARLGNVSSLLAGRFQGLRVSTPSTPGGSAQFVFRGPRSALSTSQPLFVVDGLPMNNTAFTSLAQRFGLGGFDYGSSIDDLDLASIESIRFMRGAEASGAYGGRGANGVVVITTKTGTEGPHFAIGATHATASAKVIKLPEFQNSYGQGLNGTFSFFDGRGGGLNDGVAQNWGPALDGSPVPQSSYHESGRADIRLWLPQANNVSGYFETGSVSASTVTLQARNEVASVLAMAGKRQTEGITPSDQLATRNASIRLSLQPGRLNLSLTGIGAEAIHENAVGTGAVESNPVFDFLSMGRQVSLDSLKGHVRDANDGQISWNYLTHNNPYFQVLEGDNHSHRFHLAGAGSLTYAFNSTFSATARGGVDTYRDGRLNVLPTGWMGGFPFYAGPGDFSQGGSEGDEIFVQRNSAALRLDSRRTVGNGNRWTLGAGVDLQATQQRVRSAGVDSAANVPAAGAPASATIPEPTVWGQHSSTTSAFAETGLVFANGVSFRGGLRNAWIEMPQADAASVILPNVRGSIDLGRSLFSDSHSIVEATLRGAWWLDTPESTPYDLASVYTGGAASGQVTPSGLSPIPWIKPELTNGLEIGSDFTFRPMGLGLGLTYYRERTSDVILPVTGASGTYATNAAVITNQGVDARVSARLGDGARGFGLMLSGNASKNANEVNQLASGQTSLALGPARFGVGVFAETGQPLGVIRGLRLLRDSNGALLLRNGLPQGDSAAGPQILGVGQPDWSFGFGGTLQYRWLSISAQADARLGGQVFSATNMVGTYSGTLASTAFRPDTGLLIAGVDAGTNQPNAQHVSAQDYYHALGSVAEPWVYSASFVKLRDLRISATIPLGVRSLPFERIRAAVVARNLGMWTKAPNIDPEAVFSPYQLPGVEMGQLPYAKSIGVEFTIVP